MSLRIGVDTGGTFTDLVVADGETAVIAEKSLTTHDQLADGLLKALGKAELDDDTAIDGIVHGTTVALNAILTRRGAPTGLITTDGFRDMLDMGRAARTADAVADPRWRRPHEIRPIVERVHRRGVRERHTVSGEALVPLDEEALLREVSELYRDGCRSIAVCFLHSYKFPAHEQRAVELIREAYPDVSVSASHEVAPYPKEYNRLSTAVLNAYSRPMMESYTDVLTDRLEEGGYRAPLMFMTNDGGLSAPAVVKAKPVTTLNSGPVGGVMGVQSYSRALDLPNLVGFDMGGTSTDVAVVTGGRASTQRELEIEHDILVSMPVLEIHSIGAGGGSIVTLDPAGGLEVGPQSAGSDPGPACYGRGGTQPTVTDALLLLGWLDPDTPLGGEIVPDSASAEQAYTQLAEELDTSPQDVASMVVGVGVNNMAEAIRHLTVYRGIDSRDFSLVAYGAAGPLAATQVARVLQMQRVVIPALAGVFSAYGLLEGAEFDEQVIPVMAAADSALLAGVFADMTGRAADLLDAAGGPDRAHVEFYVDAMYHGQRWELATVVDPSHDDPMAHLQDEFAKSHERQFGYSLPAPIYLANARVRVVAQHDRTVRPAPLRTSTAGVPRGRRPMVIGGRRHPAVPIYRVADLAAGQELPGPAVIEGSSYTGVLIPGDVGRVNDVGDIVVELGDAHEAQARGQETTA